ncbi:MAG TPA: AAA family ATPase, partial [Puia sp.]
MTINRGLDPSILYSNLVTLARERMQAFYQSENRGQKRYDFPFNANIDLELKPVLREVFGRKCGYCEVSISSLEKGFVDRLRPHSGIRDEKEFYPDLYWWLTFDWYNLIYCCKECFEFKANYFPIEGKRALKPTDSLRNERPLLLDPCLDDPAAHFGYTEEGTVIPFTNKGEQTIGLLRLNRNSLVHGRLLAYQDLDSIITRLLSPKPWDKHKSAILYLRKIDRRDKKIEFASYKQWVLSQQLEKRPELAKILEIEPIRHTKRSVAGVLQQPENNRSQKIFAYNDFFPIEYIHIQNFKGITDLKIDFKENAVQKKSWLFLLGENGVGKSSILQALAVGI